MGRFLQAPGTSEVGCASVIGVLGRHRHRRPLEMPGVVGMLGVLGVLGVPGCLMLQAPT